MILSQNNLSPLSGLITMRLMVVAEFCPLPRLVTLLKSATCPNHSPKIANVSSTSTQPRSTPDIHDGRPSRVTSAVNPRKRRNQSSTQAVQVKRATRPLFSHFTALSIVRCVVESLVISMATITTLLVAHAGEAACLATTASSAHCHRPRMQQ